jgi:hypothetical protein
MSQDHSVTRTPQVVLRLPAPVFVAVLLAVGAVVADWPWTSPAAADAVAPADAPCVQSDLAPAGGGGASNEVLLYNAAGGDLQVRGMAQLNQIPGPIVGPLNCALVQNGVLAAPQLSVQTAGCTGCQSYAVALQINLYSRGASSVTPANVARAQNLQCTQCLAESEAFQYNLAVDDPTQVPADVGALIREFNDQLRALQTGRGLSAQAAAAQIDQIIAQFQELATALNQQRSLAI